MNIPDSFKYFLLIICAISVHSTNIEWEPNFFDFNQIKSEILTKNDLSISNLINESMSYNWTKNHDCLKELIEIKSGLMNVEDWAVKSEANFKIFN